MRIRSEPVWIDAKSDPMHRVDSMDSLRVLRFLLLAVALSYQFLFLEIRAEEKLYSEGRQVQLSQHLNLPEVPFDYADQKVPQHVRSHQLAFDNEPSTNKITNHGATLGRVLFYEKGLSVNGEISCSSCHVQRYAFSDPRKKSSGYKGQLGSRNSMALVNLRFNPSGRFFWDERAESLESQVLMPIVDDNEMGHSLGDVERFLQTDPLYLDLFSSAFGDPAITRQRIAMALAQFLRSMISFNSRYDHGLALAGDVTQPFPNYTEQENIGKTEFFGRGRCAECHLPQLPQGGRSSQQHAFFQLLNPMVNGVDSDTPEADEGVYVVTKRIQDVGRFKASSLRNIELTAPYMHDGRFQTLDQVLEHYNWSVKPHPNLDPRLKDFSANGMAMPEVQKVALAAFLRTLTDLQFIHDPRFSDPFVVKDEYSSERDSND